MEKKKTTYLIYNSNTSKIVNILVCTKKELEAIITKNYTKKFLNTDLDFVDLDKPSQKRNYAVNFALAKINRANGTCY